MTWSYDPTQLGTNTLMQLRWLIGDTLIKDPQLQDEELIWAISQRSSVYGAACDACRNLAARLSREADSTQGPSHTLYSARARNYRMQASQYELMALVRSAGTPYSGQISHSDYANVIADPDRMGPQFSIDMDENYLPTGALNAENPGGGS